MKIILPALFTIIITSSSSSQIVEGKHREISISGSFQNISDSKSTSGSSAFIVSPRLGFFVAGGLEIEPEGVLMVANGGPPVYVLNANVAYNLPGGRQGVPFVLAGYGFSNTIPIFGVPRTFIDYGVGVLNLGAGVKMFVAEAVAVRLEYRFQNFSGSGDTNNSGYYSFTPKTDITIHSVQFGFSVMY